MGQKIHPTGFRLAVTRNWTSKWFANSKHFAPTLKEDIKIREYLKKKLGHASVGKITIERPAKNARITIFSARPGVVIGKKGEDIENLKAELTRRLGVPVAVKDLYYVEAMPLAAGSKLDVSDIVRSEGTFIRALRRSG